MAKPEPVEHLQHPEENDWAQLPFEGAVSLLEEIVDQLEDGDLTLDESLALFERGVALARHCARRLNEAERRIDRLVETSDGFFLEPAPELEVTEDTGDVTDRPIEDGGPHASD